MSANDVRRTVGSLIARVVTQLGGDPWRPLPTCPRCGGVAVVPLGRAQSSLEWFRCMPCKHVWACAPTQPRRDAESASGRAEQTVIADR